MVPDRETLRADCARCAGLCCVVPAFAVSADFAIDKPAGVACPHLADAACTIHPVLESRGFRGCTVYDCFGAGQRVVTDLGGERRPGLFAAFEVAERLHELLWYLREALARLPASALREEAAGLHDAVASSAYDADVVTLQLRADPLLAEVSRVLRSAYDGARLRGADLAGRDLRGRDLVGADLRGALLIGADLRGADLTDADVLGADLRGTDVRSADLTGALFLTRLQVAAARRDERTQVAADLR